MGAQVLPLHGIIQDTHGILRCTCASEGCRCPGKHPLAEIAPNGVKNATSCIPTIMHWLEMYPRANIGLATGQIIVLDIDPRHGGDVSIEHLESVHGQLPHTCRVLTGGGGEHIYFRTNSDVKINNSAGKLGAGLDIRGMNGYVVAPPSLHQSGRNYLWSVDHHPEETAVALVPEWIERSLCPDSTPIGRIPDADAPNRFSNVMEGKRNTTTSSIIGHLLRRFVDPLLAYELVRAWNTTQCRPPLSEKELAATVNSIAKLEHRRREKARGY
ncbi:bifunctional DNA primase/polymerase [Methylorubrum populi]